MKKSELRQLIKEELQKLNEAKFKEGDIVIYYPYGKNKDSIEAYISQILEPDMIKARGGSRDDKYLLKIDKHGEKDADFMGFNFDNEDGELASEKELSGPLKKHR